MASVSTSSMRASGALLGPAFVAAIAYVDPGNVATNISAGSQFGFLLVWVIVVANVLAGVIQYLSAKLGLVSGRTLPEAVGDRLRSRGRLAYWLQAELVAMATDVAEVLGGAIALNLLFDLPLLVGGTITGVTSMALLLIQDQRHQRVFERTITALLLIIAIGFLASLVVVHPSVQDVGRGLLPRFDGVESVLLATAMLGATIMPHAVYLHSGLVRDRFGFPTGAERRRLLRITRWDVCLAMILAGTVNLGLLLVAATSFRGNDAAQTIDGAHTAIANSFGSGIALVFAVGLLASGLASTSVGAYAGSMIMQGLLQRSIPLVLRRAVTLIPAIGVLALGVDPTRLLVLSQVLLSFGIPFALVPLVRLTSDRQLMGSDANGPVIRAIGYGAAAIISALNAVLIVVTVTGH